MEVPMRHWKNKLFLGAMQGRTGPCRVGPGFGRAGTFGSVVLMALGHDVKSALHEIATVGSEPETAAQRAFLEG